MPRPDIFPTNLIEITLDDGRIICVAIGGITSVKFRVINGWLEEHENIGMTADSLFHAVWDYCSEE